MPLDCLLLLLIPKIALGLLAFTRLSISFRIFILKILLYINLVHVAVRSSVSQTRLHSRSKSAIINIINTLYNLFNIFKTILRSNYREYVWLFKVFVRYSYYVRGCYTFYKLGKLVYVVVSSARKFKPAES